jgi:cyclopropane fatty-acyl-phospholipid synthase-like methyltransferase
LDLGQGQVLIDVGAGAGAFAVCAAGHCEKVYAVDVSPEMLQLARQRASDAGVENIEFDCAGFLTYEHAGPPADVVVSHVALHHLPDAWKLVGLTRLAAMLRPGGKLHLMDVVHRFDPREYAKAFDAFVEGAVEHFGPEMRPRVEATIRDEFPTWDWIMEGMLRRAGFHIDLADYRGGLAEYLCTKCQTKQVDVGDGP